MFFSVGPYGRQVACMRGDYYERLGVNRDATSEAIVAAYREKLHESHPDVSSDADAEERTKALIEAKEVLTDETERSRYDRLGHQRYVDIEAGGGRKSGGTATSRPPGTGHPSAETGGGTADSGQRKRPGGDWAGRAGRQDRTGERTWWVGTDAGEQTSDRAGDGADQSATNSRPTETAAGGPTDGDGPASDDATTGSKRGRPGGGPGGRSTAARWTDTSSTDPEHRNTATHFTWGSSETAAGHPGRSTTRGGPGSGHAAVGWVDGSSMPGGEQGSERSTVGWYHARDRVTTSRKTSGSAADTTSEAASSPWNRWNPALAYRRRRERNRGSGGSFEVDKLLFIFGFTFVIYPVLLFGVVFPGLPTGVRALLAIAVLLVTAFLQSVPEAGIVVFGTWTVLLPVVLSVLGVSPRSLGGAILLLAVVVPFVISVLTWLALRPRRL